MLSCAAADSIITMPRISPRVFSAVSWIGITCVRWIIVKVVSEHFCSWRWSVLWPTNGGAGSAQKRGGQITFISIEEQAAERRYALEPVCSLSPEKIYEQNCALALLERTLLKLRSEFEANGKGETFQRLKGYLTSDGGSSYAELAAQLHSTEAALKMAVSRLRARYGVLLREEVANTVSRVDEVEDELKALMVSLSD